MGDIWSYNISPTMGGNLLLLVCVAIAGAPRADGVPNTELSCRAKSCCNRQSAFSKCSTLGESSTVVFEAFKGWANDASLYSAGTTPCVEASFKANLPAGAGYFSIPGYNQNKGWCKSISAANVPKVRSAHSNRSINTWTVNNDKTYLPLSTYSKSCPNLDATFVKKGEATPDHCYCAKLTFEDPGYCASCDTDGTGKLGAMACTVRVLNYPTQISKTVKSDRSQCRNDDGIRSVGFFSHGTPNKAPGDLPNANNFCMPWTSTDVLTNLIRCRDVDKSKTFNPEGTESICTKGAVIHPHGASVHTGVLVYKRNRCIRGRCTVHKSGICLDLNPSNKFVLQSKSSFTYPNRWAWVNMCKGTDDQFPHSKCPTRGFAIQAVRLLKAHEAAKKVPDLPLCTGRDHLLAQAAINMY